VEGAVEVSARAKGRKKGSTTPKAGRKKR
jgi:hypothetical protein